MNIIVENPEKNPDKNVWEKLEEKYGITIMKEIKDFIALNSGGDPKKSMIETKDGNHEVRKILSLNTENKYYSILKYADKFLSDTKGKIIPIAVDSGGNYFCVNNETGKVYFWFADDGLYYLITDSVEEFCKILS
ncbi:MAG: SMI1/KNR4 family protein [Lachnospiraceae bacterium]|nr:SMI1/KNR4 family protein [Lachnospiraceae bacterium]